MRRTEFFLILSAVVIGAAALGLGRYVATGLEHVTLSQAETRLADLGYDHVDLAADGMTLQLSGRVASEEDHTVIMSTLQAEDSSVALIDNLVIVAPLVDLRPATLQARKDEDALTLTGEAPNPEARDLLGARAELANPDLRLLNLMKAQDRRASDAWLIAAEAAIDAVSALNLGRVSLERGVIRLEGAAPDAAKRQTLLMKLRGVIGEQYAVQTDISAPPPLLSPYVFAARQSDGALSVATCAAPDAAQRSEILGALRSAGAAELSANADLCMIANGAPNEDWTAAVTRGIAAITGLPEAELRIANDQVSLTGYLGEGADLETARDTARRGWPANFRLRLEIREELPEVSPFTLTAVKKPGETRLEGYAPSRGRADAWSDQLDAVNNLSLARGAPEGWAKAADIVISALADQRVGAATLTDKRFVLAAPGADAARAELQISLSAQLPRGYVLEVIEVKIPRMLLDSEPAAAIFEAPPPRSGESAGFRFVAHRIGFDQFDLGGVIANETARAVLLAYARAQLGGEPIQAEFAFTRETPPIGWQRALFAGLEALGELERGEFAAEPGAVYLRGETDDAGAARRAKQALDAKTPEDFERFSRIVIAEYGPAPQAGYNGPDLAPAECIDALNRTVAENPIEFESGSAAIESTSATPLDALTALVKACGDAMIEIGGHTDSAGKEEDNMSLSLRRASAVRRSLIARGADRARLNAKGYGESEPVADNDTEEGRARNRRIEFQLTGAAN